MFIGKSILKKFNPLQSKLVVGLALVSLIFVSSPLIQRHGSINRFDIAFVTLVFGCVIVLESMAILFLEYFESKSKLIQFLACLIAGLFLSLNIFNFYFVLTNSRPYVYFLICVPLVIVLIYSKYSLVANRLIVLLCCVMFIVMGVSEVVLLSPGASENRLSNSSAVSGKAKRSIYFISFDALVSRVALTQLYQANEKSHIDFLESNNFEVYDILSPGVDTTNSFVEWFSFGSLHGLRNPKEYFNGMTQNPLLRHLKNSAFRVQFVTPSNYFGIDMGLIDSFYPKNYSISICEFINSRYAFGFCHGVIYKKFLEPILLMQNNKVADPSYKRADHEIVAENLDFAQSQDDPRWFSISYISFPGHSSLYFSDDAIAIESYRLGYIKKLPELKNQFQALFQLIRDKDPEAVIVFVGDHGGYLTGRWELFDKFVPKGANERLLDLDRRSVLLGVYPNSFCEEEIKGIKGKSEASLLMKMLVDCSV